MKHLLIISFDLIKENEPPISFSIASIMASLKTDESYKVDFDFLHVSFNLLQEKFIEAEYFFNKIKNEINYKDFDFIALSAYVWSEFLLNKFIDKIIKDGYSGKIILGGNQITNDIDLEKTYPNSDIFIIGYAETAIREAIKNKYDYPIRLNSKNDIENFKSPYITGIYSKNEQYSNLRTETKRGCLYNCDYCAHVDLIDRGVIQLDCERVVKDIEILKEFQVERINIIDPVFTHGDNFSKYLDELKRSKIQSIIKIQSRFEFFSTDSNYDTVQKLRNIKSHVELGVQTIIPKESKAIGRYSSKKNIIEGVKNLIEANISFEVSLIYGLPFQTLESFKETIHFLEDIGCDNIKAFPLMLLRGTKLYLNKNNFGLKEKKIGNLQIPYVVESASFSENEWIKMNDLVNLKFNQNVI